MRKIISIVLCFATIFALLTPAYAMSPEITSTSQNLGIITKESSMPELPESDSIQATIAIPTTLSIPSRALWASETTKILETAYSQEIINISEDADYIIFEFDYDETKLEYGQLLLTKYLKPESSLAQLSSINTKLNYAWGWTEGYSYKNDKKSALFNACANIFLSIFSDKGFGIPLGTIFSSAISLMDASADYSTPISATDWVKFYYCNKIGYVQDPYYGYWLPYAYVGERRGFNKIESIVYDIYGQPYTIGYMEEDGYPSNNPTNAAKVEKKSHYDDDSWIINKALSQYQKDDGVYSDIYAVVNHFTETMP